MRLLKHAAQTLCAGMCACASPADQDGYSPREGAARGVMVNVVNASDRAIALSVIELPGGQNRGGYSDLAAGEEGAVGFAVEDSVVAVRAVFSSRANEAPATYPCADQRFTRGNLRFGVRLTRDASGAPACEITGSR